MIEILYFLRWGSNRMRSPDPYSDGIPVEQAHDLYNRRETHTALVLREGVPYAIVESHKDFVGVTFYDDKVREYLSYGFRELAPGRLFLEEAAFQEYDGDRRDASTYTVYLFKPEGEIRIDVDHFDKEMKDTGIPRPIDVSGNWEPYPAFGEYAGLLRIDRPGMAH